ncbi:hypothetical protein IMZ48_24660 [Candidatus Bathyarchaeota archaeon]|nr:hypothetical protein [Candidatus Bathyarchaeota archaeon]
MPLSECDIETVMDYADENWTGEHKKVEPGLRSTVDTQFHEEELAHMGRISVWPVVTMHRFGGFLGRAGSRGRGQRVSWGDMEVSVAPFFLGN